MMKQLLVKKGQVVVEQVPAPLVSPNNVLVQVHYSCISPGTEMTTVKGSGEPIYKRLLKRPEYIKKVFDLVKEKGFSNAKSLLQGKFGAAQQIGYSASGIVISTGINVTGISVGDRVACAGAGYANHAELIEVPVNLVVKLDPDMSLDIASTVTLGAIALQGVRRANPVLGEFVVVFGLGILGQLTVQLLKNAGCRVIGIDLDQKRIDLGTKSGMEAGINPVLQDVVERVNLYTNNLGADTVIITAAATADDIINQSMKICRKKGKVVLVGSVSLGFSREDFYRKEIDFLISTSYGPGRYDSLYEEDGQDYPYAYVRWTENRNMQEYLRLLNQGSIQLDALIDKSFSLTDAPEVYADLKSGLLKSMVIVLNYPVDSKDATISRLVKLPVTNQGNPGIIKVGIAGAGGFAQSTHLPNLKQLNSEFEIYSVMNRTGSNALGVAKQFEAKFATTDYAELLSDPEVNLVMICTRHNLHASMTLDALKSGKNVFVEKPLAMTNQEIADIKDFYQSNKEAPVLMTGFNRRFSSTAGIIKKLTSETTTPLMINYKMNAGFIANDVWVQGIEGGGRNIGEACHIYDLFNYFTGSICISVSVDYITPIGSQWKSNDNFIATLKYSNGSVCTLSYTSMGVKTYPKESCEIFFDGQVIVLNDYKEITHYNSKGKKIYNCSGKGHLEELSALADCLSKGGVWPITLEEQFSATEISFKVEQLLNTISTPN
jgi:predicted dehydrogenase/threonine dehydrogenase-like Zn-dependent dehydrogenase